MQPILLQGRPAHSEFRLQALLEDLNKALEGLAISAIDAVEVYFIEANGPLDDATTERAFALLNAQSHFDREAGFFVTPRKGTISPWSSKATDIFNNCGLDQILRVARSKKKLHSLPLGEHGDVDLGRRAKAPRVPPFSPP